MHVASKLKMYQVESIKLYFYCCDSVRQQQLIRYQSYHIISYHIQFNFHDMYFVYFLMANESKSTFCLIFKEIFCMLVVAARIWPLSGLNSSYDNVCCLKFIKSWYSALIIQNLGKTNHFLIGFSIKWQIFDSLKYSILVYIYMISVSRDDV